MRIDRRVAAGLMVILGVVLGSALVNWSDADETARYEVAVQFNTSVTQDDLDETGSLLRTFDDDVDLLILEISPPIGSCASMSTTLALGDTITSFPMPNTRL